MLNTARIQSEIISLEAFNLKASLQVMKGILPNFIKSVTGFVETVKNPEVEQIQLVSGEAVYRGLKSVNYADVRSIELNGPKGMKGQYLAYIRALEPSVAIAEQLLPEVLEPFSQWLAMHLAQPEMLTGVRGSKLPPQAGHSITQARDLVAKQLIPGSSQTRYLYGKMVARNGDWKDVFDSTNALVTRYLALDRKKLLSKVEEIVGNLNLLLARMDEYPEEYKLSGINAKTLGDYTYQLGLQVEYYGVTGFLVQSASAALTTTAADLKRLFP